jgi:hemoglobin/transferrin/lactoferrin receptor protein
VYTYMRARDLATGAAPNIEGGTPAPDGYLMVRYVAPSSRWWVEPYLHRAWRQDRLSTLDLEDRRTGATRSQNNIRSFFLNGATVRGWVAPGPDGSLGTPDDVLETTGETVAQIQDRVLGAGVASAPLYTSVPAYVTVGIRAGLRAGRHEFLVDAENLGDENYRGISWGVDAPGRGLMVKYLLRLP